MKKLFLLFPLLLLSCGICLYPMTSVLADGESESDQKEIDITLAPEDILFAINNMKPGDWAPRTLAVKNTGSKDFTYQMSVQNKGGQKLFNELILEVSAGGKELYRGKLAAFTSFLARKLTRGSTEKLDITIRFPEHLGNDFQGTDSTFAFIFTAEGKDGDTGSVIISGEVVNGGENAPAPTTDPIDEPSSDSESNSPDNPSSDSDSAPPEESSNNTDPPESSSANLPGTSTAKPPTTSILPATSTNIFNLVLFGSVFVVFGIVLMLVMYYKRLKLVK